MPTCSGCADKPDRWRSVSGGFHVLHQFEEFHGRVPRANGHHFVEGRRHDFIQPALRALRAEALGVDGTLARPHGVDSLARAERAHRFLRRSFHEEDDVAVVRVRLLAESLRLVFHDRFQLRMAQYRHRDRRRSFLEERGQFLLDHRLDLLRCFIRSHDDVAARDVRAHVFQSQLLQVLLQLRHGQDAVAADVDAAQEYDVGFHGQNSIMILTFAFSKNKIARYCIFSQKV